MILADATLEAYKQAFEMMRHYSNLRFTVLTAFVGITTVLVALAMKSVANESAGRPATWVNPKRPLFPFKVAMGGGVFIAFVFGIAEWRIGEILEFFSARTATLGQELKMKEVAYGRTPAPLPWRWGIELLFLSVYGAAIALWIAVLFYVRDLVPTTQEPAPGESPQPTEAAPPSVAPPPIVPPTPAPPSGKPAKGRRHK